MNKTDLISHLATKHEGQQGRSRRIVETLLDAIVTTVRRAARCPSPALAASSSTPAPPALASTSTGDKIKIAAAKLPKFSPGAGFKGRRGSQGCCPQGRCQAAAKAAKAGCQGQGQK